MIICVLLPVSIGICGDVCLLQDIAVEAAFPQSGITRMREGRLQLNERAISRLENGGMYHYSDGITGILIAGSRTERLAMEPNWGHPDADLDGMIINGGPLGVYVAGGRRPRGLSCLQFHPEGCPAAYCKLEVTDINRLMESTVDSGRWCDDTCVDGAGGKLWFNTYNAVRKMKDRLIETRDDPEIAGPASQSPDNIDRVQTLACSSSHPDLHKEFRRRRRGSWPPVSLIKYILQMPMLLVLVGHKGSPESEFKHQARMSWSHLELKLIQELPGSIRQGYIACKYVMKRFLEAHRGQNEAAYGRSRVCSYHLKVVFLRFLEKRPPSQITSPFGLFLDLLRELDQYLELGKLPHYFLAKCNLLENVADDERGIARQIITKILSDPLNALITCPTHPQHIYGEVQPDDLVTAFRGVSSPPTNEQYQNLSDLLIRVDQRRRQRFKEQREKDDNDDGYARVSGQTELITLADMLEEIKQGVI